MIKILLLVEGYTDKYRLTLLSKLFDKTQLEIESMNTDILKNKNYLTNYESYIKAILKKEKFYDLKDFQKVYQIIDTDGCFISENNYDINPQYKKIIYETNQIKCANDSIIKQNQIKNKNIDYILDRTIMKIYYNSCNLEHAFDNQLNVNEEYKRISALEFVKKYKDDLESFLKLLFNINKSNTLDYLQSWEYIKINNHSLSNTSNLIIFIIEYYDYLKKEYQEIINDMILLNQKTQE